MIRDFLIVFPLTFLILAGLGLFINFCRRRLARTRHGLTGMCHKNGGAMCCSCAQHLKKK
jgi:hypothetical protein